jgi:hypothetical protein
VYKASTLKKLLLIITMKSPSQTQSDTTHPPAVSMLDSILHALSSSNAELPVLPITMTNTSPESEEAVQQRRRFRAMILASAIALINDDDFGPIESSTTHQCLPQ